MTEPDKMWAVFSTCAGCTLRQLGNLSEERAYELAREFNGATDKDGFVHWYAAPEGHDGSPI